MSSYQYLEIILEFHSGNFLRSFYDDRLCRGVQNHGSGENLVELWAVKSDRKIIIEYL